LLSQGYNGVIAYKQSAKGPQKTDMLCSMCRTRCSSKISRFSKKQESCFSAKQVIRKHWKYSRNHEVNHIAALIPSLEPVQRWRKLSSVDVECVRRVT
jgi:hypothetical protein